MKKKSLYFYLIIFGAFLLRFILSFLPGFRVDISTWHGWADRLVNLGFAKFYHPQVWTHYTPGYFYILWLLGIIKKSFNLINQGFLLQLFKFPNNLADILTAILIYKITIKKSPRWALWGLIFYLFNPALIFNSSIWGQADSFLSLLMLTSFYLLLEKKKILFSSLVFSFAFLIKPQAIFILPIIIVLLIKKHKLNGVFNFVFIFLLTSLLLASPFFPANPIFGLPNLIVQMGKDYPYTTLGAFNFWRLFGNWQKDNAFFLGLSKYYWGLLTYVLLEAVILFFIYFRKKEKKEVYYLAGALSLFNFFLFPTRVHERYLLPSFPFLLTTGIFFKSLFLILIFLVLSIFHFVNLFYVYNYYYPDFVKVPVLAGINNLNNLPVIISFLTIIIFFILLVFYFQRLTSLKFILTKARLYFRQIKFKVKKIITRKKIIKHSKLYLIIILLLAFITRTWNLWYPRDYIFDEVYHGFTAQEMAKGNVKAWEWWNTPPKGFAYEWTHPPLAKLIMAGGVLFFGNNDQVSQYAFRFPAVIFGIGIIYLTYLLSLEIFKNKKIGLLAAFLVSFDGLLFVMSRVGMGDVYFLFFLLAAIYLAIKEKYFWTGIVLGLSLATKWTGVYLLLVAGLIFLVKMFFRFQKKHRPIAIELLNYWAIGITCFILIPAVIYLLSYTLFFTSGHTWDQFIELQKQMWGYHTNLEATHNYQSKAWTWPLMLRPVWFWVKYEETKIANIYNFGNPIIWWAGLLVLPLAIYQAIKEFTRKRRFQLGIIIFCYFSFWLPWIVSPRIMFLHHYLPAIPFLSILIAWFLNKIQKQKFKIYGWLINGRLLVFYYLLLVTLSFFFFYPISAGLLIPKNLVKYFFWIPSWR